MGVDGAGQHRSAGRGPGQSLDQGQRQPLGEPAHHDQDAEGVAALGLGPEPGGREGGDGPYELLVAEFQRQQAAQRVARHMRTVQFQCLEQGTEHGSGPGQVVGQAVRQRRGLAEARQIHGDHVAFGREDVHYGVPGLAVMADAVQQEQWCAGAHACVGDGHRARTPRGGDLEGEGRGHGELLVWAGRWTAQTACQRSLPTGSPGSGVSRGHRPKFVSGRGLVLTKGGGGHMVADKYNNL